MGGSGKGITIEYQDRDGNAHTVDFKRGGVTEEEGDLEDTVAPEFKKLVHDMQQGMSKQELEKKYPNNKEEIEVCRFVPREVFTILRKANEPDGSEAIPETTESEEE